MKTFDKFITYNEFMYKKINVTHTNFLLFL